MSMTRPLKRMKARENMDRISGLHNDLLVSLLSFLPTKSAVGTSILSSKWRGLHKLINRLHFYAASLNLGNNQAEKEKFGICVNTVLIFHSVSSIKTFHLNCGRHVYDSSQLHAWISAALLKKVEQLELLLCRGFSELPRGLFNSATIVELKLRADTYDLIRVPVSVHLPRLKTLHMTRLSFPNQDSFLRLFTACPLLQDLEMHSFDLSSSSYFHITSGMLKRLLITAGYPVSVDAPNLVHIDYILHNSSIRIPELSTMLLKNTNSLVTARLGFSYVKDPKSIQIALRLIKSVNHVKELHLLNDIMEHLCASNDDDFPSFPNLEKLELGHCSYEAWKYIPFLLANSPKLDTLIFREGLIMTKSREEKWPTDITLFPFRTPVKTIKIFNYHHCATELTLTEYILENAGLMTKMVVNGGRMTSTQTLEAKEALMKASTKIVVEFNKNIRKVNL